jgi:hypothetical protein
MTQEQVPVKALCSHAQTVNVGSGTFCQSCGKRVVRAKSGHYGAFSGRESDLVQQIKKTLTLNRVAVFRIGQWRADKSGSDEGVPDLMLCYDGRILMMEVKVKGGNPSVTQQWLSGEGYSVIVWSLDEAVDACNLHLGTEIKL